jgi:hypothetical protein
VRLAKKCMDDKNRAIIARTLQPCSATPLSQPPFFSRRRESCDAGLCRRQVALPGRRGVALRQVRGTSSRWESERKHIFSSRPTLSPPILPVCRHPVLPKAVPNPSLEVTVAYGHRGVEKLAELVASNALEEVEQYRALRLLRDELHLPEPRLDAIACGVVDLVCRLLDDPSSTARVRSECARILTHLLRARGSASSSSPPLLSVDAPMGTAARLAETDPSPEVRAQCAAALEALVGTHKGAQLVAARADVVAAVVAGVGSLATPSLIRTVAILAGYGAGTQALLDVEATPSVVRLLSSRPDDASQVEDCLSTLRAICGDGGDAGKAAALAAGAVPLLLPLIRNASPDAPRVRQAAVGVVALMTIYLPAKRAVLSEGPDAFVPALLAALNDRDGVTASTAVAAIRHLSEVADGRGPFLSALLRDSRRVATVFGVSVADELLHLVDLASSTREDRAHALEALVALVDVHGDAAVEAVADAINGGVRILVDVAAASFGADTLTVRDRTGRLISQPMHEAALELLRRVGRRSEGLASAVRAAYERVGLECRILG